MWHWPLSTDYNRYQLAEKDAHYLDSLRTVSFLVIRRDSIVFESYRDRWNDTLTSNIYSATKTIVGLLAGVALDEGKIHSLDDPVSRYIPVYTKGMQADVTLRHLLTMSGGMAWDEAYASLFSVTTHGYYGNDLYDLVTGLEVVDRPGVQYSYRSGETQLLAFVIEAATGQTLSDYAEEKLWRPMQAERDAYWLLDKKDGDEKAFCCFHTTARDVARFGSLLLHRGNWHGRQLVSEAIWTTDASRFVPERPVGQGFTQLLWFPDVGDGLSRYALLLHAWYAGSIHYRYSRFGCHCRAPGP